MSISDETIISITENQREQIYQICKIALSEVENIKKESIKIRLTKLKLLKTSGEISQQKISSFRKILLDMLMCLKEKRIITVYELHKIAERLIADSRYNKNLIHV